MNALKYTLTRESAVVVDGAEVRTVRSGTPHFAGLREALLAGDWEKARGALTSAHRVDGWSSGAFALDSDGAVRHAGQPVPDTFGRRVLDALTAGEPVDPLLRFFERLARNPSWRSRRMLFDFMQNVGIPVAPDGRVLAYKGVTAKYRDVHSSRCGDARCGCQSYDNRPGVVNEMPRSEVSDDPDVPCHAGFHVGSAGYAKEFGERVVVCVVDPADVVCVPRDCGQQKMRVCRYEVAGHFGEVLPSALFSGQATAATAANAAPAPIDRAVPDYTAEGLMALPIEDLRRIAVSLGIVGAEDRRGVASRAALAVSVLRVAESLREIQG